VAELECEITIENIIHKGVAELAANVMDKFGIAIDRVGIDWIDVSSAGGRSKAIIKQLTIITTMNG